AARGGVDRVADDPQEVGQGPAEDPEDQHGEQACQGEDEPVLDEALTKGRERSRPRHVAGEAGGSIGGRSPTSRSSAPSADSSATSPRVDARLWISRQVEG